MPGTWTFPAAPEIGDDDREVFGQARGDAVPHQKRLGVAVGQAQRGIAAAVADPDRRLAGLYN